MKVAFLFPNSTATRFTAAKLLETGYEVVFYCPSTNDVDIAQNIIFEMNILGKSSKLIGNQHFIRDLPV